MHGLVTHASRRNSESGITGALVYSGTRFAQTLEGPGDAVEDLFERIRSDDRHILEAETGCEFIDYREFKRWSLCYAGPSLFVARTIADFARTIRSGQGATGLRMLAMIAGLARVENSDHYPR